MIVWYNVFLSHCSVILKSMEQPFICTVLLLVVLLRKKWGRSEVGQSKNRQVICIFVLNIIKNPNKRIYFLIRSMRPHLQGAVMQAWGHSDSGPAQLPWSKASKTLYSNHSDLAHLEQLKILVLGTIQWGQPHVNDVYRHQAWVVNGVLLWLWRA